MLELHGYPMIYTKSIYSTLLRPGKDLRFIFNADLQCLRRHVHDCLLRSDNTSQYATTPIKKLRGKKKFDVSQRDGYNISMATAAHHVNGELQLVVVVCILLTRRIVAKLTSTQDEWLSKRSTTIHLQ